MNKKFSTLVASLLLAGAWTTLDAKVVKITNPVIGGSYLIGTTVYAGEGTEGKVAGLFQASDLKAPVADASIAGATNEWKLESVSGDQFYLRNGSNYLCTNGADALTKLEEETANALKFTLESGKLKVAENGTQSSSIKAGWYLQLSAGAVATGVEGEASGSALEFGVYSEDAYNSLPGLVNAKTTAGVVDCISLEADETVDAPLYITDASGNYLSVKYDGDTKEYKLATGDDALGTTAPTAAQSLNASWRWVNGKLVSVAAERDGKVAELNVTKAGELAYNVVNTVAGGTKLTVKTDGLYLSTDIAISQVSVSATSVAADANVTVTPSPATIIVDGDNLPLLTSVSGDYCLVKVGSQFLKANAEELDGVETAAFSANAYENFLWKVTKSAAGSDAYNYTFTSMAKDGNDPIVWESNGTTTFVAKTGALNGLTLTSNGVGIDASANAGAEKAIIAFYQAPTAAKMESELNKIYNLGFEMTVKISKNGTETIEGIDVFGQKMYAISSGNTATSTAGATSVQLWNNADKTAKGAKVLVLDVTEEVGNNDNSAVNGKFKWITKAELEGANENNYKSYFQFRYSAGKPDATGIEQLAVLNNNKTLYSVAYILPVQDKYYLTSLVQASITSTSKLPYINLGASNIYAVTKLLGQYLSFSYADTKANAVAAGEEYKLGGMLAVTRNSGTDEADFITGTSATLPEAQWAVTKADKDDNTFVLTNRENKSIQLTGAQLREVGNKFIMTVVSGAGSANITTDLVTLTTTALSKTTNFDGYMQSTPNALRNENFYLGQYHAVEGNNHAYFVENHTDKASHQIGMTAEKENAQKWNLHLATKADEDGKYTLVDTVKVPLVFATLIDGKIVTDATNKDVVKDTLFILPYAFQNASNREFVSYKKGKGYNFYFCNEDYKENSDVNNSAVIKFALKMKPNNTYNFVELTMNADADNDAMGTDKVLGGNSADKGIISHVETYDQNANSLMVVEKADAPEYHKIAMAWGDTIKLFREENDSQVLYEKRDAKSVVDKDTLSFLNIDNVNQFTVNPAIFADTAYINRTIDGEANTCYQYLLAVNVDPNKSYYCPYNPEHNTDEWRDEHNGPCADAKEHRAVAGRFLINLIDTANVYGVDHLHSNPYINGVEAGEKRAKLSFVEGIHADDTLYITRKGGEAVKIAMDSPEFNIAKFAFRYVDSDAKTFKIQTQYKNYIPTTDADVLDATANNEGYLKWINGTVVVEDSFEKGDVFSIEENYEGNPTANESIDAASTFSVATIDGAVIVKGAEGKAVTITNVLGQTIASTVVASSEATIAVPAGVVVVAVEGEAAVKAIVK